MKSKVSSTVTAFILLTIGLLMCGCSSYVCVGTPLADQNGPAVSIRVPITVTKHRPPQCENGLKIEGKIEPADVPLLWSEQGEEGADRWVPSDGNTYIPEKFGQDVQFKIDVTALNKRIRARLGKGEGPYHVFT